MGKKYIWSEGSIPTIDVHSTKKHDVLKEYLRQYILILGGSPFQKNNLKATFIDGFSGGGIYLTPEGKLYDGSPLIFLETTQDASKELSKSKGFEFKLDAHYIFIDKERQYLRFLMNEMDKRGYKGKFGKKIFFYEGFFEHQIDKIIAHIKKRKGRARRCVFLLDQYGYSDVPLSAIRKIFRCLPKAEVILTFYVDYLIDYLCESNSCQKSLDKTNLSFDIGRIADYKSHKRYRGLIQKELYRDIFNNSGTSFLTNFFIKSNDSHKSYWLLHLSTHPKARDEMQRVHWELQNHFSHEGEPGLFMLGYDPCADGFECKQDFLFSSHDRAINHKVLMEDIPRTLPEDGISYNDFFLRHCNTTPSTSEMIRVAVRDLYLEDEIRVFTENGKEKRRGKKIKDNDIIKRQDQRFIF